MSHSFHPTSLREYDIRGIIGETLGEADAYAIGRGFGTCLVRAGGKKAAVGYDGRVSSPMLEEALVKGLNDSGADVVRIGMGPTPMLYYAEAVLDDVDGGIEITGSHNPANYNGFKMVLGGAAIYGEKIQGLYQQIQNKSFKQGQGQRSQFDIFPMYLQRIVSDVHLARPMKITIDCGNGVGGAFATQLFRALGCEVEELFCEVDGNFPNHHPDPAHLENLQDLIQNLTQTTSELGLAFDGDADRLGVVTKNGEVIFPDRQLMLYAKDVLSRNPGSQIIYDVKCTRALAPWIREHGGQPLMWKTGHSLVKAKLKETGAPLAGEMSGHIFFKDRWFGFDDGLYTAARLLEILSKEDDPNATLNQLPNAICTPELQLACTEGEPFAILEHIKANASFPSSEAINTIDGVRVEYPDGFGLARPSNTTPVVVIRFEADTQEAILRIQAEFKKAIIAAQPAATLPF